MSDVVSVNFFPRILAIDTSCDDTSAAVTCGTKVLSNVVASQTQLHKEFGGVFPTVARQAHRENIDGVVRAALRRAQQPLSQIHAIAVTQGPGLAPSLEVGIHKAKTLCQEQNLPLLPINHIEGHTLSCLANTQTPLENIPFPALAIVVSGGHTEFILIKTFGKYERIGFTLDDAAGEALDKFGRMIDLGYPAGPIIEQFAKKGDPAQFHFPIPMKTSGDMNLSFSGLKTAARNLVEKESNSRLLNQQDIFDLCASFQTSVFRAITYKLSKFLQTTQVAEVWLGGGVASNIALRAAIRKTLRPHHIPVRVPYTKRLCIDNAAMIGIAAGFKFTRGESIFKLEEIERLPRWHIGL